MKKAFWDHPLVFPLFLFLICVLAYGVIAPSLGFSWDDWPALWLYEVHGVEGLREFFSTNRPLLGVFYLAGLKAFGANPLPWHVYAILVRFGVGLSIWWALKKLWPAHQIEVKWVAVFAVVFPGFGQQSIAIIYSPLMLAMIFYFLSIGFMLRALDDETRLARFIWISVFFSTLNLFATEYFFGLELIRPLFLYIALSGKDTVKERLKGVWSRWWPYVLLLLAYLAWRIPFQARFQQAEATLLNAILVDPLPNLAIFFQEIFRSSVAAGYDAWVYPFQTLQLEMGTRWGSIQVILIVIGAVLTLGYFFLTRKTISDEDNDQREWVKSAFLLSLSIFLLAGLPFTLAGLPVKVTFPHDRFMLAFILGSCLLLVLLATLVFKPIARQVFLSLLLAACLGYQVQVGRTFKQEWENVSDFIWQLSWRAPGLEPGTTLIAHENLFPYTNDFSLTAPVNWLYDENSDSGELDYFVAYVPHRLGGVIPELSPDQTIHKPYSLFEFNGSTSHVLTVVFDPPACLRILDPSYDRLDLRLSPHLQEAMWLSAPDNLILPAERADHQFLEELLTTKPIQDKWCHTYQKASLARQLGDWDEVVRLAEITPDLEGSYISPIESLPFIEGYARLGEQRKAFKLTMAAYNSDVYIQYQLCDLWWRVGADAEGIFEEVNRSLGCR